MMSSCAGLTTGTSAQTSQLQSQTFSISGTINPITGGAGLTLTLSGTKTATTTADGSGTYTFGGLSNGTYAVTPSQVGYTFTPPSRNITINGTDVSGVNFTAAEQTFSISGTLSPAPAGSGATVALSGSANATTAANAAGVYTFTGLADGSYILTPMNAGYSFTPASQNVTVNGANVSGVNFTGSVQGTFSISGTITPSSNGSAATVNLSGAASATVTADNSGAYVFGGLSNGTYTIAVSHPTSTSVSYAFTPANQNVTVNGANISGVNFTVAVYFGTEPSHSTYLPRSDSYCSSAVNPNSWEPRPDNDQANHTILPSSSFNWSTSENYWTKWASKRAQVTGNFTGTTTEIIQWAACKWGIDEDTIRADAVKESYWHQSTIGDVCGPAGEGSYGLMQIKNEDCTGTIIHGGYPDTMEATPLNVDWYAAHIRSCYDGDFYDGGYWLYDGQTVDQIAAEYGWSYVFWACIGFHYSGDWEPGQPYQVDVQNILANRTWESPNF